MQKILVTLLLVFILSYSWLAIAKNPEPAKTLNKTPTKISVLQLCGEDYTIHPITELSQHYQDYFNGEYGEKHWYYCVLDEEVMDRSQCASGWSERTRNLYSYECQKSFETEESVSFPDSSGACYTGYLMDEDFIDEENPIDGSFFASYQCKKDGARYSEAPCTVGHHRSVLHNSKEVICYK